MNSPTVETGSIRTWLDRFAACVRAQDIEAGKALFDPSVRAFGTRVEVVEGLDELAENQWRPIWFSTSGYRFMDDSIVVLISDDGTQVVVLARWESTGYDANGHGFTRRGRCTLVLKADRAAATGWRAIHTHFSLWPR